MTAPMAVAKPLFSSSARNRIRMKIRPTVPPTTRPTARADAGADREVAEPRPHLSRPRPPCPVRRRGSACRRARDGRSRRVLSTSRRAHRRSLPSRPRRTAIDPHAHSSSSALVTERVWAVVTSRPWRNLGGAVGSENVRMTLSSCVARLLPGSPGSASTTVSPAGRGLLFAYLVLERRTVATRDAVVDLLGGGVAGGGRRGAERAAVEATARGGRRRALGGAPRVAG